MTAKRVSLAALFLFLITTATAQPYESATVAVPAPVFLDRASRTPLATLEVGTHLKVLSQEGEWYRVSFRDRRFGERIGFVRANQVTISKKAPMPTSTSPLPARDAATEAPPVREEKRVATEHAAVSDVTKQTAAGVVLERRTPSPASTSRGSQSQSPVKLKDVKIRGYVTEVTSPTEFQIEDYRITREETFSLDFENASPEIQFQLQDIRVGVELQIKGMLNEQSGDLRATGITVDHEQFKSMKQTAFVSNVPEGMIKTAEGWTGRFQADGQTIVVSPATQVLFKLTKREKQLVKKQAQSREEETDREDEFEPLKSLEQVTVGMAMTYEGRRNRDTGHIMAERVEFSHNDLEEGEAKMWSSLKVSTKAAQGLKPGELKIDKIGKYKLLNADEVQTYVAAIGRSLIPAHQTALTDEDPHKIPFQFHVVIDEVPNAFATPNGIVVVHTGLLEILENEAQLAAVLGHEIAHSTHEHSWRRQEFHKKKRFAIGLAGAVASAYGLHEMGDVANLINAAIVNGHSRSTENQADRVGLQYMIAAGYDPREAPKVWKLMAKKTGVRATDFFWSSHENHATRRSYLMNELKNNYRDLDYAPRKTYEDQFRQIQQAILDSTNKKIGVTRH